MQFIIALNTVTTSHSLLEKAIHKCKVRLLLEQVKPKFQFESRNGAIKEAGATHLLRFRLLVRSTALGHK